jgi:hypothetical protein
MSTKVIAAIIALAFPAAQAIATTRTTYKFA